MNVLLAIDPQAAIVHERDFASGNDTVVRVHEEAAAIECLTAANGPRLVILAFVDRSRSTFLCRRIRKLIRTQATYVIIVSDGGFQNAAECMAAGADDYVILAPNRDELAIRYRAGRQLVSCATTPPLTRSALETLSVRDPLTSLYSRRCLITDLGSQIVRANRSHDGLSCLLADIDQFKVINDTAGHLVGDKVIGRIAGALTAETRASDLVYRYGGDEFFVIMPGVDRDKAIHTADRIRARIARIGESFVPDSISISASVGVAVWRPELGTPIRLLQQADAALLAAKRAGRDRTVADD